MIKRTFRGTFYEIGKQKGAIYKKNGMSFDKIKIKNNLFRKQMKIYEKYYPNGIEELEGVAEASGYNKDKVAYRFITTGILPVIEKSSLHQKGCTIFGIKEGNKTFVGRNYDWCRVTEKVFELYKTYPKNGNAYVAITDMDVSEKHGMQKKYLYYYPDDLINDKGLFISLTSAFTYNWNYGLTCGHMLSLIAETCQTVNDAVRVFERVPLCGPKNFFIADKEGDIAAVQHTAKKFKVVRPHEKMLIQTNNYTDPELILEDKVLEMDPTHNTFLRYYQTLQRINSIKSKFKQEDIIKILGDKNSYMCQNRPDFKTIWSWALDMKSKKYKLYWDLLGKRKEVTISI